MITRTPFFTAFRAVAPHARAAAKAVFPDFNGNGVADYREPWLYRAALGVVSFFVRRHGSPALKSAVDTVDALAAQVDAKLREATQDES